MSRAVAVIHPYWSFWESSVPGDFRAERQRLLDRVVEVLRVDFTVVVSALVGSPEEAARVADECARADAVVMVSTMAAPPTTAMALLERVPDKPVVVWALHEDRTLPEDFSHSDITTRGATVGGPMIVSALARAGRRCDVVMTSLDSPQPALAAIRYAAAAGAIRGARVLRIGSPMPGYSSVVATDDELAGLGIESIVVDPAELASRSRAVTADAVADLRRQVDEQFAVDRQVDALAVDRSLRIEAALAALIDETGATAGALNCHVPELRFSADVGVAPCLALGRLTTTGVPWTCSGDVVTAIAMLTVQSLGLPTLYHEVEAVDYETDEVVLANTGEHDLRLCGPVQPVLAPDAWYTDDPLPSACALYSIPASAASLVGFAPLDGLRWIVAEGEFTGSTYPRTGTPNAGFRFASGHVSEAWPRWLQSGVVHHSAATNALVGEAVGRIAHHLGGHVVVV